MLRVKICGITNKRDYDLAVEAGADLAGFILVEGTPRNVDTSEVLGILRRCDKKIGNVALFLDREIEEMIRIVKKCAFDLIQLHGEEPPEAVHSLKKCLGENVKIMKTFKVEDEVVPISGNYPDDYEDADFFVFDTYHPVFAGGTGQSFDPLVLKKMKKSLKKPFFVAGGLRPENISEVVKLIGPYGVDVSSGVERSAGKKDENKLKEFIDNAKNAR